MDFPNIRHFILWRINFQQSPSRQIIGGQLKQTILAAVRSVRGLYENARTHAMKYLGSRLRLAQQPSSSNSKQRVQKIGM